MMASHVVANTGGDQEHAVQMDCTVWIVVKLARALGVFRCHQTNAGDSAWNDHKSLDEEQEMEEESSESDE